MIGTSVGDDLRGHNLVRQLEEWGAQSQVRFSKEFKNPLEVDVSDETRARTYFWQRAPEVLNTLDTADLSYLEQAHLLYVDWYDGDQIVRVMDRAIQLGLPVFLNLEHGHADPTLLKRYAGRAVFCQAVTEAAQRGDELPIDVAKKLMKVGVKTALITMAEDGCLGVQGDQILRIHAPVVHAVDGCGAGATFSAGFIYCYLQEWDFENSLRFATAAASLQVTRAGLQMFPTEEIKSLASKLEVKSQTI